MQFLYILYRFKLDHTYTIGTLKYINLYITILLYMDILRTYNGILELLAIYIIFNSYLLLLQDGIKLPSFNTLLIER